MKKRYLFGMALMSSLAFYSCSNEDVLGNADSEQGVAGAQFITLQVDNGGDGLVTRAGRPLYSAEAKQSIDNVKLWICNGNEVVYVTTIDNWNASSTVYEGGAHGRQKTIELTGNDKLEAGTYQIYVVGYSNLSDYTMTAVTNVEKEGTFSENMQLPISKVVGEEIFAGQLELNVVEKEGFKTPVVLNRQVAGAFAYVEDIPYFADAKYLKLVASAKNNTLVLGNFNSVDLTGNGTGNSTNVKYVVNGIDAKSGTSHVISTIDLTKWFTEIKDADGNNLIDVDGNWNNPLTGTANFKTGSVFGGEFVIPFAKNEYQTLTLQLTDEDGAVLRSWNVNLRTSDVASEGATYWNGTDWNNTTNGESVNNYSIVRNHLYGIGTRSQDNPETPEEPDDKPESLNNKQELVLKVNDNWEVIHGMELE